MDDLLSNRHNPPFRHKCEPKSNLFVIAPFLKYRLNSKYCLEKFNGTIFRQLFAQLTRIATLSNRKVASKRCNFAYYH